MSAFEIGGIPEDVIMALTSQEKKVLGFIGIMVLLGWVMLAVRKTTRPEARTEIPAAVATTTGRTP